MKHIDKLNKLDACNEAVREAKKFKSGQAAWDNSARGDWMLWLVGRISGKPESAKRKKLVLCACECARLALVHVPKGENRPLKAIETAEAWARGEATIDELRGARGEAWQCYATATATATAAAAADYAAAACADYAAACAAACARKDTLKKCADIVRKHYPKVPVVKL